MIGKSSIKECEGCPFPECGKESIAQKDAEDCPSCVCNGKETRREKEGKRTKNSASKEWLCPKREHIEPIHLWREPHNNVAEK